MQWRKIKNKGDEDEIDDLIKVHISDLYHSKKHEVVATANEKFKLSSTYLKNFDLQ